MKDFPEAGGTRFGGGDQEERCRRERESQGVAGDVRWGGLKVEQVEGR